MGEFVISVNIFMNTLFFMYMYYNTTLKLLYVI